MALYTIKNRNQAFAPIQNYNGNNNWVLNQRSSMGFAPTQDQTQLWNMIGRDAGLQQQGNFWDNPIGNAWEGFKGNIENRARAAENALGTTGAAIVGAVDIARENANIDERNARHAKSLEDIYRNSGYNSSSDFWDAKNAAEQELFKKYGFDIDDYWNKREQLWNPNGGNSEELAKLDASREAIKSLMNDEERNRINRFDEIENQLRGQTAANANEAKQAADNWRDYTQNSYIGKKINQDQGKFLGDAMTTVSTGADIAAMGMGLPMGVGLNALQGGWEGVANELSQNGFENFDWGRAGQNIASGALAGAATAGLNKVLPGAKQGGLIKSIATGAGRGALSGAVGGAVGAGVTSALSGQDIGTGLQNVLAGAGQGAVSGGVSGGIMGGVNNLGGRAINAIDRKFGTNLGEISQTGAKWQNSGKNFNERLTNTLNSGDSAVGNWINGKQSKTLNSLGNIGNRISPVGSPKYNKAMNLAKEALDAFETADPYGFYESMSEMAELEGLDWSTPKGKKAYTEKWLQDATRDILTGGDNREMWAGSLEDYIGQPQLKGDTVNPLNGGTVENERLQNLVASIRDFDQTETPTTASGWAKKALKRAGEDLSNKGVGLSVKNVSDDDDYQTALNRGLDQGLSGPELGDELARFSGLPEANKMLKKDFQNLYNTDSEFRSVVNTTARDLELEDPMDIIRWSDDWDQMRANYAAQKNYEGPEPSPYMADDDLFRGNRGSANSKTPTLQQISEYGYDPADVTGNPTTITADGKTYYKIGDNKWATRGGSGLGDLGGRYRDDQIAEIVANANDVNVNPKQVTTDSLGKKYTGTTFNDSDLKSRTPAQDAYANGRGSFSDALDEFMEQGMFSGAKANKYYEVAGNDPIPDKVKTNVAQVIAGIDPNATMDEPYSGAYDLLNKSRTISELRNNLKREWGGFLSDGDINRMLGADTWAAETPTTASGWLKKAAKRAGEDLRNKGVGLSIQDLDDGGFNVEENDELIGEGLIAVDAQGRPIENRANKSQYSNEDFPNLVNGGNYIPDDELESRIHGRINNEYSDDINGMKINRNDMLDTAAEGPETELYRQLTGGSGNGGNGTPTSAPTPTGNTGDAWDNLAREYGYNTYNDAIRAFAAANPNTPISAGAVTTWLDSNEGNYNPNQVQITQNATMPTEIQEAEIVPSKTSRETKLKYAQGKELLAQYGAVDQPMARATKAPETFQKLAEMGFTKPGDVEKISNAITGSNGAVSKLTKSVIASAKPVNTFDGETAGQTMDDFINNSIEHNMLSGTNQGKAVKRGIDAYLRSLPSHADGSITMEDSAADAFKVVQGLEARAAELEGRGGSTYHRATTEDVHQAAVLKDVANLLKDRIYAGANVKAALTPEVAQELKAFDPKNTTWAKTVDDFVSSAKTAQDLRSFQKPFVRASRYIDNQYVQAATAGGRMAASAGELPAILPTTKAGIIKQVVNNVWNSNPAHRARAAAYGKLAENAAANAPQTQTTAQPAASNPQTAVYDLLNRNNTLNIIGRHAGEEMGQKARPVENYIEEASAESGYMPPLAATTSTAGSLEDLANTGATTTTTPTTLADSLGGGTDSRFTGQFSSTGNDQVDLLGRAMELAMAADDADAFAALYGMYNNALSSLEESNSDLSAAQQTQLAKFASADDAINELESLYNQAGGGKGPIAGNLQSVAGDWGWDSGARTYNQMAEGLVNQIAQAIGKTDSLNTEGEVQRALKLVPSLTDDAQTAQNKLRTLREMLAQTKANYYGAYGV